MSSSDDPHILIDNQCDHYHVDIEKVENYLKVLLSFLDLSQYELSLNFVSSAQISQINQEFRSKSSPTDVLSFPQVQFKPPLPSLNGSISTGSAVLAKPTRAATLGDIVICPEVADKNAESIGQGLDREVAFLLIHGLLHLCGYDHIEREDEKAMLLQQNKIWSLIEEYEAQKSTKLWKGCVKQVKLNA